MACSGSAMAAMRHCPITSSMRSNCSRRPYRYAGCGPEIYRWLDLEDSQRAGRHAVREFRGPLPASLRDRVQGMYDLRPNDVTGSVLSAAEPEPGKLVAKPESDIVYMTQPLDRPEALLGKACKLRWPESDHTIYFTMNDIERDGRRRPFEVFINSKNMEHYACTVALTRMISAAFRRDGDVAFVVEELKAVFDPRGGQWVDGKYVPSLLVAIGGVIEHHMIDIGFLGEKKPAANCGAIAPTGARQCPICGSLSLVHQEGCDLCTDCKYSRCG